MKLREFWYRTFLVERPSVSLSLFRIAVAVTVGCHMIPSFLHLDDNYLSTAFKDQNTSFFPLWVLRLVAHSPDWLVLVFVGLFAISWGCFLTGFRSQLSAILMGVACYYFYALNAVHIGTLSFDILLVTLSLFYVTGYHGDAFSVDSVRRADPLAYKRARPFFIQRLLQLQIAWTFWYTALSKITAGGNWLTDNPYYYLMNYPSIGVVREFPFRHLLAQHPAWCHAIGLGVVVAECSLPVFLFIRTLRPIGLAYGMIFHVLLLATLHVPTIFFFLFPPQLLLFVEPERVVGWIDARRAVHARKARPILLYDGRCGFCQLSVSRLQALDCFGAIEVKDFHAVPELARVHPDLTPQRCQSRMQLIEPSGRLSDGFLALRRIALRTALLWPTVPWLYLPGVGWLGQRAYDGVAKRRFFFHRGRLCETNQCGRD
ncbi:MAG: DUF393 domain-containing protein [Candidatus Omnitrophica bacterium]|nr:DUF393 domain-containing protein [Candidatus Omnitrophota bacterium]